MSLVDVFEKAFEIGVEVLKGGVDLLEAMKEVFDETKDAIKRS